MAAQNTNPITSVEELTQAIQASPVNWTSLAPLVSSLCPGITLVQSDYLRKCERAAWTSTLG